MDVYVCIYSSGYGPVQIQDTFNDSDQFASKVYFHKKYNHGICHIDPITVGGPRIFGNRFAYMAIIAAIHFMHGLRNRRGGGGNCPPPRYFATPPPKKKINSLEITIYKSEYSNMAK